MLDPQILDMVEQLIGPDIALWNMSFFAKPPGGKKTPMHQDGEYWLIVPLATCTVWIAIDEATVENGVPALYPGPHKQHRLMVHEVKNEPTTRSTESSRPPSTTRIRPRT